MSWYRPTIGFTNGCFDILHAGHVDFLARCRNACDYLIVALNSDSSVRRLKGEGRPINTTECRVAVLGAIRHVDKVVVFSDLRVDKILTHCKPDIWFKGGDYTIETLDTDEVHAARAVNCVIQILPITIHTSTTKILEHAKGS